MIDTVTVDSASELAECRKIRQVVFIEEQGVPPDLEYDHYDASPDAAIHVMASYDGIPAGCGRLIRYDDHTAKLQRLAVLADYRGKGVGKALVQELEHHAKVQGYDACILDGQCQAEPFYTRLGYVTISQEPFEDAGIMHVRMRKKIAEGHDT